jgi:hypothetical protein
VTKPMSAPLDLDALDVAAQVVLMPPKFTDEIAIEQAQNVRAIIAECRELRATVERVRALADSYESSATLQNARVHGPSYTMLAKNAAVEFRAALGPAVNAEATP